MNNAKYKKIIVHGGTFHADDVLCVAFAKELFPNIDVERVVGNINKKDINSKSVIICDVGKQYLPSKHLYDHHNNCPNIQGTDIKHSAIGLMLQDSVIQEAILKKMNRVTFGKEFQNILKTVEAMDNGTILENGKTFHPNAVGLNLAKIVDYINPVWDSDQKPDDTFGEAVQFLTDNFVKPCLSKINLAKIYKDRINAEIEKRRPIFEAAQERANVIVNASLEKMEGEVCVLPQCVPWQEVLVPSNAKFVVYPSNRGGYNLQCVPAEMESFEKKVELPDWSLDCPEGMFFEHPKRFIAAFNTEDQAIIAGKSVVYLENLCKYQDVVNDHIKELAEERAKIQKEQQRR